MKHLAVILTVLVLAFQAFGQSNKPAVVFIKGTLDIKFNSRTRLTPEGKIQPGITDNYAVDLNYSDRAKFTGTITNTPPIFSSILGRELQAGQLDYRVSLSVVNPANISQVRAVGNLTGTLPVDARGVYRFQDGSMRIGVNAIGRASAFESKFSGIAEGRPPKSDSAIAKLKKEAISLTREIGGKKVRIVVNDYDKMRFISHGLPAGPVASYTDAQVNGEMLYDYERTAWYFQGVTISYTHEGKPRNDKLTGNVRWIERPRSGATRDGEYQFDIRFNEPEQKPTESAVFAAASDESSFFESDPSLSAITGTMQYKDTFAGEAVSQSAVKVDLTGSKIDHQQGMTITKLIFFSCIVPFNAE